MVKIIFEYNDSDLIRKKTPIRITIYDGWDRIESNRMPRWVIWLTKKRKSCVSDKSQIIYLRAYILLPKLGNSSMLLCER